MALSLTAALPTGLVMAPLRAAAPSTMSSVKMETVSDLKTLAKKCNPILGYWNPLGLGDGVNFWGESEEATIGWLRHAEIKHGRVAMAAFVGFTIGSLGLHWPWKIEGARAFAEVAAAGGPGDQWDALSTEAKYQIVLTIGFLEVIGESDYALKASGEKHYMRGGKPGFYPSLKAPGVVPHPVPLDLFDPTGITKKMSAERKEQALVAEINNGRWAMIGIIGCVAASKGLIVPGLDSLGIAPYAGEYMSPFMVNGLVTDAFGKI